MQTGEQSDTAIGRRTSRARRYAATLALLIAASALAIALAEGAARLFLPFDGYHRVLPLVPHQRIEVQLIGSSRGLFTTNAWGLRGEEPPSDWRQFYTVVAIGGSTTQCVFLDDHQAWPHVLQKSLRTRVQRVWVGNGGIDGHLARSHVLFMHDVVSRIRPDAVVVLAGVNDMLNSLLHYTPTFMPYELRRKPSYLLDNSHLLRRLEIAKRQLIDRPSGVAYGMPGRPLPPLQNATRLPDDVRSMLPTLGEYRENLRTIARDGRALGVRVVFLTQPLLYEDTDRWRVLDGTANWVGDRRPRLSAATVWQLLDVFNEEVLAVCAEERAECFDLANAVPHSEAYFYDWCHFNEAGARLVGDTIAGFLVDSIADAMRRKEAARQRSLRTPSAG